MTQTQPRRPVVEPAVSADLAPRPLDILVVAVLSVCLFIFSNGPLVIAARRIWDRPGSWEDPLVRPAIVGAAVVAGLIWLLTLARGRFGRLPIAAIPAAAFTLVAVISARWSVAPALTRWRAPVYLGLFLAAWVLASLSARQLHRVLLIFSMAAVSSSLLTILAFPGVGIDDEGAWRGLYTGPNSLAPLAAIAGLMLLPMIWSKDTRVKWAAAVGVAIMLLVLLRTSSVTAMAGLIAAVGTSAAIVSVRRAAIAGDRERARRLTLLFSIAAVAGAAVVGPLLWNADSFTLRRELWGFMVERIGYVPLKGHGFFAFWSNPRYTVPRLLARSGSAHSSPLEVLLGLGFVGFVPYALVVLMSIVQPIRNAWRRPDLQAWIWLTLALFLLAENLTESFVLWFSYNWVLVMASAMREPRPALLA